MAAQTQKVRDMRPTGKAAPDFDAARRNTPAAGRASYVRPAGADQPPVDITVFETPELRGHEAQAEEAIFILSQSATGRRLMQSAMAADYGIVFMDDPDKNLRGYVDNEQRLVFLAPASDVRQLALTLGHELAHVSQTVNGGISINVIKDHPLDALKKFMAIEADARAYEIKIALELEYAANPAARFAQMLDIAAEKSDIAALPALVEKIRPQLPDAPAADKIMAACFRAFYYDTALRATYENKVLARIEQTAAHAMPDKDSYSRRISDDDLMRRLDAHDIAYLDKNRPHTDIADPRLRAVCPQSAARLQQLQDMRGAAGFDAQDWTLPVYHPDIIPAAPRTAPASPKGNRP